MPLKASSPSLNAALPFFRDGDEVRNIAIGLNHAQPGDPSKLAKVLIEFADVPNPPVRLPLGSDTVAAIEAKHVADAAYCLNGGRFQFQRTFLNFVPGFTSAAYATLRSA